MARHEFGQADDFDEYYRVRINADKDVDAQVDTLIHEWAHLLTGWIPGREHSDNWGRNYALCYRVAHQEN